jgi:hypothetical protein
MEEEEFECLLLDKNCLDHNLSFKLIVIGSTGI